MGGTQPRANFPGLFVNGRLVDVSGGLHRLGDAIALHLR